MKKQHTSDFSSLEKLSLSETLDQNPYVQWFTHNAKTIFYIFMGLIIFFFFLFRIFFSSGNSEKIYYEAQKDFTIFQKEEISKNPLAVQYSWERLNQILRDYPQLHAKYDGPIAQTLFNRGQVEKAKEYALRAIERTSEENQPFYSEFSRITLAIEERNFSDSLQKSLLLKEKMLENATQAKETPEKKLFGDLLFALNLIRIGMLQQELAIPEEELKTWKEWKEFATHSDQNIDPKAFQIVQDYYSIGNVSLSEYLEYRERLLNQKR